MLFRKHIVSTRTLLQLAAAVIFSVAAVGAASAANSGIAPLLVPYTVNVIAGTPQYATGTTSVTAGYAGDGGLATPTLAHQVTPGSSSAPTLNGPFAMAVDSVGNVYITDKGNDIIREVNAQSGNIYTIAGVIPKGCTGASCTLRVTGCADGVPAQGAAIGSSLEGIAVDAYGNVYFMDTTTGTLSVIYRGGTQVAAFIKLVNPGGVAASGGTVQAGYVYHVAGAVNLTSCSGVKNAGVDNGLAFTNTAGGATPGAEFASASQNDLVSLDSAGNIYVADTGNATVRVINTQATPQTFFQYTVQPGYMRSISNCNAALTVACPTATTTSIANTGINGPVNAIVFNSQYKSAQSDAFGNLYQLNGTGSGTGPPGIYAAAAYAGGAPLTNLLTAEAPSLASSYGPAAGNNAPAELPLTYGNSYIVIGNPSITSSLPSDFPNVLATQNEDFDIRPTSLLPDNFGTFWYMDNHYPELNRIDQYTSLATLFLRSGRATANISPLNTSPASFTNPYYCVYGSTSSKIAWTQGPQTYDPQGDGCPAVLGYISGGDYQTISDGLGNIYVGDGPEQLERVMTNGNIFPATAVGTSTPLTQPIQVHFNSNNPPQVGATIPDGPATGYTTTAFSIAPGISDFTINTTTPEFPMGSLLGGGAYGNTTTTANFQMWAGLPTCTALGAYPSALGVTDLDCLVYVSFNPTAPGVRQSQLVVTTANGSVYNIALYGIGTGGQLALDGGVPSVVGVNGIGTKGAGQIAVSQSGVTYVADPSNNRVIAYNGTTQSTIGTGLSAPQGVAVDSANNVYIADTGNNRVIEVNPITSVQTVLGNYVWIPGSTCYTTSAAADCPTTTPGTVSATTAPPQYTFKAPESVAVDKWNNVYVADTGNAAVVEIPSSIALGGAVQLLNYPGAPKFFAPNAVTVDSLGNIYVADPKAAGGSIVKLPPGGGDLVTVPNGAFPATISANITTPVGVAVDAAGNVYVADANTSQIIEVPLVAGSGQTQLPLNFPGIGVPGNLALDANGNLYVVDTTNKQILFDNRKNPVINFGNVPQGQSSPAQPLCGNTTITDGANVGTTGAGCPLTVTNIGNQSVTIAEPITVVSGSGNAAYILTNNCATPLLAGAACQIQATFTPTSDNGQSETVVVNGGPQSLALTANGEQPLANIVLSPTYSSGASPAAGATATITATVTQPHITGNTPTGTVTFTYVIDAFNNNANSCGTGGTATVALNGSGIASFQLPVLAQGVQYTVSANYNGDALNSQNTAAPLTVSVPGTPVTATITSTPAQLTFTFGGTPPTPVGTVTPTPAAGITVTFGSAARANTPITNLLSVPPVIYPVIVSFSGTGSCAYGNPSAVYATGGGAATVTENPAPLSYVLPPFTSLYGAPDITYGLSAVITGEVNGDTATTFSGTFTPAKSSILNVGTYTVTPTVKAVDIGDYTVTAPTTTLTVTKAPAGVSVTAAKTSVANTAAGVAAATYTLNVSTAVPSGIGVPTGTVTVYDVFNPIISTTPPVAAPNLLPSAANTNLITITDATAGASIYYTLNGSTPTASSTAYTGPVTVASGQTLEAIAISNSQNSNVVTLTQSTVSLTAGVGTYIPTNTTAGIHQYSFGYSGDSNFQSSAVVPSTTAAACIPSAITANCLIVDYPDFTLTSNTGPVVIIPGVVPSGNGLLSAPNQSSAAPETAVLFVNAVLGFTGSVSMSCQPQSPSYVSCFMTPTSVCFASTSSAACTNTATTAATVVAISTPATLPLGFKTSEVPTSTTKTVLAFLPFGVLAFCVRRRRRLSKALWMLIAVAAISAGMTGCGGNQVDFYTPIPTGAQTVTVTATYLGNGGSQPAATRTFVVPIAID